MKTTVLKILFFPLYALLQFAFLGILEGSYYLNLPLLQYAAIVLMSLSAVEMWQIIHPKLLKVAAVLAPFLVYWSLSWYFSGMMRFCGVFLDLGVWYGRVILLAIGFAAFKKLVRNQLRLRYYYGMIFLLLPFLMFIKIPFNLVEQVMETNTLDLSKKDFKTAYSEVFEDIRDNYYYFDLDSTELSDIDSIVNTNETWDSTRFDFEMARLLYRLEDGHFDYHTPQNGFTTHEPLGFLLRSVDKNHYVQKVSSSGVAFENGVRPGFLLTAINDMPLDSAVKAYYERYNIAPPTQSFMSFTFHSMLAKYSDKPFILTFQSPDKKSYDVQYMELPEELQTRKNRNRNITLHSRILPQNIGYIRFGKWPGDPFFITEFDRTLEKLWNTKGLIIDLRGNTGGFGPLIPFVAGRLTEKPFLYGEMFDKERNELTPMTVVPRSPSYLKKVVVLIDELSVSASALFTLAAKKIPHIEIIGKPSLGLTSYGTKFAFFPHERSMVLYNGGFVFKNTADNHRQINPNIYIHYDLDAIREERDYELDFARARF